MEKRLLTFITLSIAIVLTNVLVMSWLRGPRPANQANNQVEKDKDEKDAKKADAGENDATEVKKNDDQRPEAAAGENPQVKPADAPDQPAIAPVVAAAAIAPKWVTLGSANSADPYRMLVTITNFGAAVERIELNSPRYRDLEDRSGYLGHFEPADAPNQGGALVRVVGQGTPAAIAGLQADDVIEAVDDSKVQDSAGLLTVLLTTKPAQSINLTVSRMGAPVTLTAVLGRRTLDVVRPEFDLKGLESIDPPHDPLSLLLTLQQAGGDIVGEKGDELKGLNLREGTWEVVAAKQTEATFQRDLPQMGLRLVKRFVLARLAEIPSDPDAPAYHLMLSVEIHNTGDKPKMVAYRLDGPTGLPIEGAWYANKVNRNSTSDLRTIVARAEGGRNPIAEFGCSQIADEEKTKIEPWVDPVLDYAAVDCQYFAVALIPQITEPKQTWVGQMKPVLVGAIPKEAADKRLTNVSFRVTSKAVELAPNGRLVHQYQVFAGPKKPALLAKYGPPEAADVPGVTLQDLVYYGWFWYVAEPMLKILHTFYALVGNYGIAILMLTVLVRGCMFPLSRKQALSAQKMQELQPEMKRINEKYKKNPQEKNKAVQDLFRKHNYNPFGGCLLALIQLPIFIGLYRSLSVDVELRQAPLLGDAIRWCSNLAAPDMLWYWYDYMPAFFTKGTGFFSLGPYLNILPLVTIGLFIWQQKMFMPPPADENAAMQQKIMQYMMIVMGFMFYKVASGLCLYFIASSMWGICERKLLPKTLPAGSQPTAPKAATATAGNGAAARKQRERK